jgi:hypothetical protein
MKRTGLAILLVSVIVAVQGCGVSDPGQPPIGSISVKAKSDFAPKAASKQAKKPARVN